MKSNVLYLMIVSVCFGVTACGGKSTRATSSGSMGSSVSTQPNASEPVSSTPVVEASPSPTVTATPTPTPTPVQTLVTQTSLGAARLNVYDKGASDGAVPFGTLSLSIETLTHSPGDDGHPVANDSVQVSGSSFPVYFDSVRSDGLVLSIYPDSSTIQKIKNPIISDIHSSFKVPQSVCTHFVDTSETGGAFGGGLRGVFNISCSYSDAGTPTCHYDASGQSANYPGGSSHPEFVCDRSAIIYPTSKAIEDFTKLKTLSIQVFDDERNFSLPSFNPDTGEQMLNKIVHLTEDQIVFSL